MRWPSIFHLTSASAQRIFLGNLGVVLWIFTGAILLVWAAWALIKSFNPELLAQGAQERIFSDETEEQLRYLGFVLHPPKQGLRRPRPLPLTAVTFRARRILMYGLAALWLLDGLLQAQPAMVTQAFIFDVVQPAVLGQPPWLAHLMSTGIWLWQKNPFGADLGALLLQVGIGALLFFGPDRMAGRIGLWLSVGWGLLVWVFGEGMGGMFVPGSSFISGAPGSVLLYVLLSLAILLPVRIWKNERMSGWLAGGIGALWLFGAFLQASPDLFQAGPLTNTFEMAAMMPQPLALTGPISAVLYWVAGAPALANAVFVAMMAAVGLGLILSPKRRWPYLLGGAWLLFVWWVGEGFGGIFSGISTDLNSGIVWGLALAAGWQAYRGKRAGPSAGPLEALPVGSDARRA